VTLQALTTAPDLVDPPLWQSPAWAAYQRALGRETRWYANQARTIAALAIIDRTAGGFSVWDLPRGPVLAAGATAEQAEAFLRALGAEAKRDRALALHWSGTDPRLAGIGLGRRSRRHEQPEATIVLDLTLDDEALLAQMRQKGRYNIRLAEKHGVQVEQSADVVAYAKLAAETAARDGFTAPGVRQFEWFLKVLPGSFLLLAYAPGDNLPVAGLLGVAWGRTGIYYYGASRSAHRELMAPYLLQWEAMRLCRNLGCARYDLLGIAPPDAPPDHPWQGISAFKGKFGGAIETMPAERTWTIRPFWAAGLALKRRLLG
jgi:lipid II:glycine glycyltransferase (peptidoglycan interpeptide bridge formation enzyme)